MRRSSNAARPTLRASSSERCPIQVLRLVLSDHPCTDRQITKLVQQDRPVARTTVLKTMQRLEEKGLLKRDMNAKE